MEKKSKILELIQRANEEEFALISALPETQRSAKGTLENWAPKDVFGHIAAWMERFVERLSAALNDEPAPNFDDYQGINDADFEKYRDRSWDQTREHLARAHASLIEILQSLGEDDFLNKDLLPQGENALWNRAVGSGYTHTILHLAPCYLEFGALEQANRLNDEATSSLLELDDNPTWRGTVIYNQACSYALTSQPEKALSGLREALQLNPELTEWSKEDSDFDSIRDLPGYKAIYND